MKFFIGLALLLGFFSSTASAQTFQQKLSGAQSVTDCGTAVECDALINRPGTPLRPPVADMRCIDVVQNGTQPIVITFWSDAKRTRLVCDSSGGDCGPFKHEKADGPVTRFKFGTWRFRGALNGRVEACNDQSTSTRGFKSISEAIATGECLKLCLLGADECLRQGYNHPPPGR